MVIIDGVRIVTDVNSGLLANPYAIRELWELRARTLRASVANPEGRPSDIEYSEAVSTF